MAIRIAIVIPIIAAAGFVLLLNGLDAGAGVAAAALGLLAVASGAAFGYFADRLPELSTPHRVGPAVMRRID
jgi:hypothetical protein